MSIKMSPEPLPPKVATKVLHASSDATVITDKNGLIIFSNREAEVLFGYEEGEMLGEPIEILMPNRHREAHEQHRNTYESEPYARPMVSGLELYGRRKDGQSFRAEIALTPVDSDEGTLVASSIRPIETADRSDAYFRTMLESAPDAMVIVDENGRIAVMNAQAERMFGYRRDELKGQEIETLLPERLRGQHVAHRNRFSDSPSLRPMGTGFELAGRRKDGSEFPVEISLSPVKSGANSFVTSVIRDVTSRKEMEQEIITARQEAERANKANSAFLAAASHDLRQPVQALSLLNGALRRTVKDERSLEMVEHQEHSLTAMTNLLNSLLDISRLDAGAVSPDFEEFPMQRLIDRFSDEFSRQARQKGLSFSAAPCKSIVRSDPNLLSEIIQNFVSNAIRYTDKGSVTLSCVDRDGYCCVRVEDTGIGIEDDQLEEIFKEFHQGTSAGAGQEGFGLGLAIVRRLADLMEHDVAVVSEPGRGSCFSLKIPIAEVSTASSEDEHDHKAAHNEAVSGLVILIEDDVSVAGAWGLLLEAEGYRVATAASAKEARAVIRHLADPPALVISDFHLLDGSTGVEAVREIRGYYEVNIPAFIVSGDTSKVVKDARPLENCTLMSKPVNTGRLLAAAQIATKTGQVPQD